MNREIKFRGKDYQGNWHYGSLVIYNNGTFAIAENADDGYHNDDFDLIKVKIETVRQSTGLLDKDGKEIYEGDIVTSDTYPFVDGEGNQNYHGVVIWLEDGFVVETVRSAETTVRGISEGNTERIIDFLSNSTEVIGNIYDNPELLKEIIFNI